MNVFSLNRLPVALALAVSTACGDATIVESRDGPIELAGPWMKASPEAVAIDRAGLSRAHDRARDIPRMRSLLVVRRGHLVFERYYGGWTADTLADVRSVTKSVVATLVGIALEQGHIAHVDQAMTDFLPVSEFDLVPEHEQITVRHLLTMTGGFQWNESSGRAYNEWILSGDHDGFLLRRPVVNAPGSTFTYNSAAVHLLGIVVQNAVGRDLPEYADEVLFEPLGIGARRWEALVGGYVNGGAGLDLRPRDLARIGQLYLQDGRSGDRSLVPSDFVDEAGVAQLPWTSTAGPISRLAYGFLWWIDLDHRAFFAWGFAGQFIYVVPNLDLVVVANTEWRGVSNDVGNVPLQNAVLDIIVSDVLPAVR